MPSTKPCLIPCSQKCWFLDIISPSLDFHSTLTKRDLVSSDLEKVMVFPSFVSRKISLVSSFTFHSPVYKLLDQNGSDLLLRAFVSLTSPKGHSFKVGTYLEVVSSFAVAVLFHEDRCDALILFLGCSVD